MCWWVSNGFHGLKSLEAMSTIEITSYFLRYFTLPLIIFVINCKKKQSTGHSGVLSWIKVIRLRSNRCLKGPQLRTKEAKKIPFLTKNRSFDPTVTICTLSSLNIRVALEWAKNYNNKFTWHVYFKPTSCMKCTQPFFNSQEFQSKKV